MTKTFTLRRNVRAVVLAVVFLISNYRAFAQIGMGSFVTTYTQDFNSLPSVAGEYQLGVNTFLPDGWAVYRSASSNVIMVNNGSWNTGGLYSYGNTGSTDRALGALTASSIEVTYNLLLQNTSGRTITELDVAYTAEQWRVGSINTDVQRLLFTYAIAEYPSSFNTTVKLNTPGWTTVPSMQFNSPVNKMTAGHVNGNQPQNRKEFTYTLPEAIPDGYYVMLRWYDPDELQQDHGLAIDDVKVTWHFMQNYTPLPVELSRFTAKPVGNSIELAWTTASELDSRHFEIERSTDGKQFKQIGIVKSQGTTSLTTHYTYTDTEPVKGSAYYRLKQVDEDMTYTYSKVVVVSMKQNNAAALYPTIAFQEIKVEVPQATAPYQAVVYDSMGKSVLEQHLLGSPFYTFNVSMLGHGNYTFVLFDEQGQKQMMRFLKK